jgi:hypothetical protein
MSDDGDCGEMSAARLRIVVDNETPKTASMPKPKKTKRRYAQADIDWLSHPVLKNKFTADWRLYLLLQYVTRRGTRSVRLTNELAAEAALDRHHKSRFLKQLEIQGLVKVTRRGKHNPEVVVIWPMPAVTS